MSEKSGRPGDDFYAGKQISLDDYFLDEDVDHPEEKRNNPVDDIEQKGRSGRKAGAEQNKSQPKKAEAAPEGNRRQEQKSADGRYGKKSGVQEAFKEEKKDVEVPGQQIMKKEDGKKPKKTEDASVEIASQEPVSGGKKAGKAQGGQGRKKEGTRSRRLEEAGEVSADERKRGAGKSSSDSRRNNAERSSSNSRRSDAEEFSADARKDNQKGERKKREEQWSSSRKNPQKKQRPAGEGKGKSGKRSGLKVLGIVAGIFAVVVSALYIGVSLFFTSHFYINTKINGHEFSAKSVEDVERFMRAQVEDYTLTIVEKENKTDTVSGKDISLKYEENKDIKKALEKQNAFLWPQAFFKKNSAEVTIDVSYDHEALDHLIDNLQAVKAEQIPATSAYPKFDGTQFVVEPEVTGTAVDMDILRQKVKDAVSEFQPELKMEEEGCYALPQYTSESVEVKDACNEMNKYLQASITYTMDEPIVVDRGMISNWVTADENMNVTFHEDAVRAWLAEFGQRYDTVGTTRTITSPQGRTVEVSGGTYGWGVDEDTEFAALVNSIRNGEVITKEPAYCVGQTAASHGPQDWGSTYAEVDLAVQHMWYIVDGVVAMESDVVTGVPIPAKETTPGVFSILEKSLNKTLVGEIVPSTGKPEYETPVAFWMRITWSGIGFHDATWQPAFGGSLYSSGYGSHGCVNMPYDAASTLYNMMPEGTPVIVHY